MIGVVGDIRNDAFERSFRSIMYRPYQQAPVRAVDFAIRAGPDPYSMYNAVRIQFMLVDKDQPIDRAETLLKQMNDQVIALNYAAVFMAIFGVIALVLTCVGVYGMMAYSVTERTHEIGLRMALGATRGSVLRTVMWRGIKLTGIGLAIGLGLGLALSRLLQSVIHGVGAWDPLTFTGVPLALIIVALTACYIPARRAIKVDPMVALRYE